MPESIQHKLDRVRPPRVQITYDVEIGDAIVMKELPFVVGIMADLWGDRRAELPVRPDPASRNGKTLPAQGPREDIPVLKERKYVNIDRDNFNDILKSAAPRLAFTDIPALTVERYTDETEEDEKKRDKWRIVRDADKKVADVALEFKDIEDFSPINLVMQVKALRDLYQARTHLSDLVTKLEGNDKLDDELTNNVLAATADQLNSILAAAAPAAADASAQPDAGDAKKGGKK